MAFNMTQKPSGKSKFIPENHIVEEGQHYAIFNDYIELGLQEQKTQAYPDKRPAHEAIIGFELTDQTYERKDDDGNVKEYPMCVNRRIPLYASEKANSYKFFQALASLPTTDALKNIIDNKVKPKDQQSCPKMLDIADSRFTPMIGGNAFLNIAHGYSEEVYKDCYPQGTTAEEAKDGKVQTVAAQTIKKTWNNFNPASVSSTFHPRYGYEVCERHENSRGPRVFDFDAPTVEGWKSLDNWMQERIKGALNYGGSAVEAMVLSLDGGKPTEEATDKNKNLDDIPF